MQSANLSFHPERPMTGYHFFKRILMVLVVLVVLVLLRIMVDNTLIHRQLAYTFMGISVLVLLRVAVLVPVMEGVDIDFAQEKVRIMEKGLLRRREWEIDFARLAFRWDSSLPELWLECGRKPSVKLHKGQGFTTAQLQAIHRALQTVKGQYHYPGSRENE